MSDAANRWRMLGYLLGVTLLVAAFTLVLTFLARGTP